MTNDFILQDRVAKIKHIMLQYGIENFVMSYSGGKDSTVLSALFDIALPNNNIPRVYSDTGIELNMIRDFVINKSKHDKRIVIIKPQLPVVKTLIKYGYPFKSKSHSATVDLFQRRTISEKHLKRYLGEDIGDGVIWGSQNRCIEKLRYQFTEENKLKISDKCCVKMKEEPLNKWVKEHGYKYNIIGLRREEGGRRKNAECLAYKNGKLYAFQPLAPITNDWIKWFIDTYNIDICDIYKSPYNFKRTGCKGCPFAIDLQQELNILEKFFPNERKQCEVIWKPVYDEYRRINYRLKGGNND